MSDPSYLPEDAITVSPLPRNSMKQIRPQASGLIIPITNADEKPQIEVTLSNDNVPVPIEEVQLISETVKSITLEVKFPEDTEFKTLEDFDHIANVPMLLDPTLEIVALRITLDEPMKAIDGQLPEDHTVLLKIFGCFKTGINSLSGYSA